MLEKKCLRVFAVLLQYIHAVEKKLFSRDNAVARFAMQVAHDTECGMHRTMCARIFFDEVYL